MHHIFITLRNHIERWCTFPMMLEDLLVQTAPNFVASFAGAALFWRIQCPNKRCCQMKAVRAVVERTTEESNHGT